MDPLTIATTLIGLVQAGTTIYQRYTAGEITAEQAQAMLSAASDHLTSAVAAFEAAGVAPAS